MKSRLLLFRNNNATAAVQTPHATAKCFLKFAGGELDGLAAS